MLLPIVRAQWTPLFLLCFAYGGFILFLYGFFPLKYHGGSEATWDDLPRQIDGVSVHAKKLYKGNRTRVILIVIDALRYDFVESKYMPFTSNLIKSGKACLHRARAEPPTVTMPRIKAMTTGSVSNFIDVALNFGSSAVTDDSFLNQAKRNNKFMVFYGDDTWLRLFPDTFQRSDGTTSFYVSDYTEVDNNVTRHLPKELAAKKPDWDLMILHYLGLDHIGHLEGPRSPKVIPKMHEMDFIVENIHNASKSWEGETVLIICGDHGMKDSGSHGGASNSEIMVPLVITHSRGCSARLKQDVDQVDLAPTISYLLGLPIPSASTGQILLQVLSDGPIGNLSSDKALYALYYNAKINVEALFKTLGKDEVEKKECYKRYLSAVKRHGEWLKQGNAISAKTAPGLYLDSLANMSEYLIKSIVEFDMYSIVLGIIIIIQTFVAQIFMSIKAFRSNLFQKRMNMRGSKRTNIFIRIIYMIFVISISGFTFQIMCGVTQTNSSLCKFHPVSIAAVIALIMISSTNFIIITNIQRNLTSLEEMLNFNAYEVLLIVGTIIHPLTYGGTSFIEEEHQTWYFFWTSLMFLILAYTGRILLEYYHKKRENYTEIQDKESLNAKMEMTAKYLLPQWVLLMILHRFLRALNQTGDKWAFLPDVGDWLNGYDNMEMLSLFTLAAILSTIVICQKNLEKTMVPYRTNCFLIIGCTLCILIYRASTQVILVPFVGYLNLSELYVIRIFWILIFAMIFLEIWSSKQYFMQELKLSLRYNTQNIDISNVVQSEDDNSNITSNRHRHRNQADDLHGINCSGESSDNGFYLPSVQSGTCLKMKVLTSRIHVFLNVMILMCMLYLRPHNLMLIPSICFTSALVNKVINYKLDSMMPTTKKKHMSKNVFFKTLFHFWIGSVFYFYQGNSNSLASIDLGSGYIGLESYIPFLVGLQMGIHTFIGPLLAGLLLLVELVEENQDWDKFLMHLKESISTMAMLRTYPLLVYTIICALLRYHLFVWTVFSPKLLYEFTLTLFSIAAIGTMAIFNYSIVFEEKIFSMFIKTELLRN